MTLISLRDANLPLLEAVLALNAAHEAETSPLDLPRLRAMIGESLTAGAILGPDGTLAAFLLAFAPSAAYDSPNFIWFRERHSDFSYIDRVVTHVSARGRGLGRRLYAEAAAGARTRGLTALACEVNLDPPNPGSDAFHAALGFSEVGRAMLASGKTVRYLRAPVAGPAA